MSSPPELAEPLPRLAWPTPLRMACGALAAYAMIGGAVTLIGWTLGKSGLQSWDGSGITMKPNAALCALLAGTALLVQTLLQRRTVVRALGALVCTIGVLTLFEHLTRIDVGVDTLLFDEPEGALATTAPGRMGPPAASSFTVIGMGLLLAAGSSRSRRWASGLALVPIMIAALGLVGYLYGASQLYSVARVTGIASQTATMLLALGAALVLAIPEHGFAAAVRRDDPGGVMIRRLIAPIVLMPVAIAWLRHRGEVEGLYDGAFGTAARTLFEIVLFVALVWWTANGVTRQARAKRAAEEALREANRRKDEFLATLAHELRNPLAPLSNALELLRTRTDHAAVERARTTMQRQLAHMVHLVDDLLDVSRISRGAIELRKARIDLRDVLNHAVEASQPVIDGFAHELTVVLPNEPIYVDGDAVRLCQVAGNLLHNAAKYTAPRGQVLLTLDREGDEAVVRVRDDGVGIPPDMRPRIFDMFTRVEKTPHGALAGLGIGLGIAKQLVTLHDGSIAVESPPPARSCGSEFIVRLPIVAAPASVTSRDPASNEQRTAHDATTTVPKLTILIADDNVDAAETLGLLLSEMGHSIRTAHDGVSALAVAEELRPDMAFLDIGMPDMTGYEVCREIRGQSWGHDVLLVALTGWGQPEDRENTAQAGFDHHLVKPASLEQIRSVLEAAGARKPPAQPTPGARGVRAAGEV